MAIAENRQLSRLQRLRDHHLAFEVTAFSGRLSPLRSS
jgi:hypothetical protein